jgi:biopolymer transport protein ExbB/TolQ
MQTLYTIILFLSGVSSFALAFLATYSFFALRRMERRQRDISRTASTTLMLTMGEHLKSNVEDLNDMQHRLSRLVEDEQYEAAEQLKGIIEEHEQAVRQSMEQIKRIFGDNVDIQLIKAGPENDNES